MENLIANHFPHATVQLFSSLNKEGLDEVWDQLDEWMEFERPKKEAVPHERYQAPKGTKQKRKKKGNIRRFN